MPIRKVARMGHPVLRQVAQPVDPEEIKGDAVQRLIADLLDTVEDYDGAGLAAPQIHASVRVVVLTLDPDAGMEVWINPVLTPSTTDQIQSFEGCLSVPGLRGLVTRPAAVHVDALDEAGNAISYDLEGFPAIVAQHECDHLDGVIYVDKVEERSLTFKEEHQRWGRLLWAPADSSEDDDETDESPEPPSES
jgi:peptide deformylase